MVDYEKILRVVLEHFAECEGTDYLDEKGEVERFSSLSEEENAALTRIRDEYRTAIGWWGYEAA